MTSSRVAATAADETVQKVGGSRKSGVNAEWRDDGEVCELERERRIGIRNTEVWPKDTVKVRGGYVRDGEECSPQGDGQCGGQRHGNRRDRKEKHQKCVQVKKQCCTQKDQHIYTLQNKDF